jgi:hypothetical protein
MIAPLSHRFCMPAAHQRHFPHAGMNDVMT